ncbi:type II secretion system minor pseudopilin GspJ [Thiotrichales bacterium HSG14]|nr:type II secretion system minor pseudopilin GspJ [Thiotrichales bacterium HSG14]
MLYFKQKYFPLSKTKNLQGFTLLELLVALAIFAVIAVMAYSGLNTVLTVRLQTEQYATQLAHLQMAMTWFGRDIEQYIERPIREQYGDKQLSLQGTNSQIELTRAGWRNPAQQQRSSLQRVAYHLEDQTLLRLYWRVLDRAQDTQPNKMALLNDVNNLQLRYLDKNKRWHEQWPSSDLLTTKNAILPIIAIEVTLKVKEWGRITRLFRVPGKLIKKEKLKKKN